MAGGRLRHNCLKNKAESGPCVFNQATTEDHDPKWGWGGEARPEFEFTSTKLGNHEHRQRKPARVPGPGSTPGRRAGLAAARLGRALTAG